MGDPLAYRSMKDVVNCDKPREAVTSIDPGISEWGNPTLGNANVSLLEHIG